MQRNNTWMYQTDYGLMCSCTTLNTVAENICTGKNTDFVCYLNSWYFSRFTQNGFLTHYDNSVFCALMWMTQLTIFIVWGMGMDLHNAQSSCYSAHIR